MSSYSSRYLKGTHVLPSEAVCDQWNTPTSVHIYLTRPDNVNDGMMITPCLIRVKSNVPKMQSKEKKPDNNIVFSPHRIPKPIVLSYLYKDTSPIQK